MAAFTHLVSSSRWRSATAPPVSPPQRSGHLLCHSAPASNKPHPAEKRTPVWLAIRHSWAGFANSQHRDAAFATPNNICAHSFLLPHWAAQTDANLSAHLHRLPTPPPYLRRMRQSPSQGRRCLVLDEACRLARDAGVWCWMRLAAWPGCRCCMLDMAVAWLGAAFLQITARANPCSSHLWGTLARAVASI